MAAVPAAFTVTATLKANPVIYRGLTIRETAGSTASIVVRSGGASGVIVETLALAANESVGIDRCPIQCTSLHVTVTGTVEGSVFHE